MRPSKTFRSASSRSSTRDLATFRACVPSIGGGPTNDRLCPVSTPVMSRRHAGFVRVTHWLTALAFAALLLSGVEVLLSHPRFYWGETGNVHETPLFSLPVPSSRGSVPTGYDYVLPDQNGWSRYLHFQSAWLLGFTGLAYLVAGVGSGHFRRNLMPAAADLRWSSLRRSIAEHLRFSRAAAADPESYNPLQRLSYLIVIFVLVPCVIWT